MVTSEQASIKNNNGVMQLVIPVDSSNTAGFGDRTFRIVKKMSIEDLATMWGKGANSFSKDPPNAGMYLAKKHGIVVLKGLEIKNANAIFTLTMDDNTQDTLHLMIMACLLWLLKSGANPSTPDKHYNTAYDYSKRLGTIDNFSQLVNDTVDACLSSGGGNPV